MTRTEADRSNQSVADAIVSSYQEDPSNLNIGELLHPEVLAQDWMTPGLVVRGPDQFNELFNEKASRAFPDATEGGVQELPYRPDVF